MNEHVHAIQVRVLGQGRYELLYKPHYTRVLRTQAQLTQPERRLVDALEALAIVLGLPVAQGLVLEIPAPAQAPSAAPRLRFHAATHSP